MAVLYFLIHNIVYSFKQVSTNWCREICTATKVLLFQAFPSGIYRCMVMYRRGHPVTLERTPSSSPSSPSPLQKKQRKILSSFRIFVIHAKIPADEVESLHRLAESLGADINRPIDEAEIIITAISAPKRLERHIDADHARAKKVVTPLWLTDSASREELMPFDPYFSIRSLRPASSPPPNVLSRGSSSAAAAPVPIPSDPDPSFPPSTNFQSTISYKARFATHRLSPLKCLNQELVDRLAIIMRWRFLEGDSRSELSYSRSISVLKAYPRVVRSSKEVVDLPGLGPKLFKMIDEFLKDGEIKEARRALSSPRFGVLSQFSSIYGIGPSTARRLYDQGYRTFEDLEGYYDEWEGQNGKPSGKREALLLRDDLAQKISRTEVEEMAEAICKHLDSIQEGFQHTVCGGYRRGKEYSNDVDIV
ncbi:hypothetical protein BS47DRAFT_1459576, partial [Hydnum rufescens UP504]